jgi:hypothetical protein
MRLRLLALAAAVALPAPTPALAQIRASEFATVSQVIDGTKIAMDYSRPRVRNRTEVWGKLEHWGDVWTPGANWATTLEVSKPVKLEGHAVPAGKYSVWFTLREPGDWTLVLDPRVKRFHMDRPDTTKAAVLIPVRATDGPFTEVLTWSFPEIRVNGATLAFNWERKQVHMKLDIEPSLKVEMAEAEAKPYLGRWDLTSHSGRDSGKVAPFHLYYEDGTLKGNFEPKDEYFRDFAMIQVAPGIFTVGLYEKGEIYEVLRPDVMFTFVRENGVPVSFQMRGEDDALYGEGKRPAVAPKGKAREKRE